MIPATKLYLHPLARGKMFFLGKATIIVTQDLEGKTLKKSDKTELDHIIFIL